MLCNLYNTLQHHHNTLQHSVQHVVQNVVQCCTTCTTCCTECCTGVVQCCTDVFFTRDVYICSVRGAVLLRPPVSMMFVFVYVGTWVGRYRCNMPPPSTQCPRVLGTGCCPLVKSTFLFAVKLLCMTYCYAHQVYPLLSSPSSSDGACAKNFPAVCRYLY